jgi:hypothetical protein
MFRVYWDSQEQRRLVLELSQTVTWEEFAAGAREAHALVTVSQEPTTLVVWAQASLPDGLALWRLNEIFGTQLANVMKTILIPREDGAMLALVKRLAGVIRNLHPAKCPILFASTMEEARALSTPLSA